MSKVRDQAAVRPDEALAADSIGLFGTTSSTLANIAPAPSVFLTIPAIVIAMGSMAPWAGASSATSPARPPRGSPAAGPAPSSAR